MEMVNPVGRENIVAESDGRLGLARACQCSTVDAFMVAKTPSDNCFHCGCQCSSNSVDSSNHSSAFWTMRSSTYI